MTESIMSSVFPILLMPEQRVIDNVFSLELISVLIALIKLF